MKNRERERECVDGFEPFDVGFFFFFEKPNKMEMIFGDLPQNMSSNQF